MRFPFHFSYPRVLMPRYESRFPACSVLVALLVLAAGFAPSAVHAQDRLQNAPFNLSFELNGGAAFYGHFLEQQIEGEGRQRELTAQTGPSLGGALGVRLFERNVVRLSVDYLPTELEYQDDTGDGNGVLDTDGLTDLSLLAASLEAERTFFQFGRLAPYASVGLSAGLWGIDGGSGITAGDSETLFRWGGTSGIGARVELTSNFYLNIEANALSMGNPFDGSDAFLEDAPRATFDEPTSVNVLRVRGGLRYLF